MKKTKAQAGVEKSGVPEWLPEEALKAIRTGGSWDGMPDSGFAADGCTWFSQDDEGEWRSYSYPTGYVVEEGKLLFRVMSVDSDGDWDFCDEAEAGTPEEKRLEAEYGHEEWLKTYKAYLSWVAEHGEDPMDEFFVKETISTEEKWRAQCNESVLGVRLVQARKESGKWMRPGELPVEVVTFLQAENRKGKWIMGDFQHLEDLEKIIAGSADLKKHSVANKQGIAVGFSVKVSRPNRRYKAQLVKAAKAGLKGR